MSNRHQTARIVASSLAALLGFSLLGSGCLASLDADKIPGGGAGTAGASMGGSAGTGGSTGAAGTAGTGGVGNATGTGGSMVDASDADADAGTTILPYDDMKHPVTAVAGTSLMPLVIAADASDVFRAQRDATGATIVKTNITSGTSVPVSGNINRPRALLAPSNALFVFSASTSVGDQGQIQRATKDGGGLVSITDAVDGGTSTLGRVERLALDPVANKVYFTARSAAAGSPQILRVDLSAGAMAAETIYVAEGTETSLGNITVQDACIYWISSGALYSISKDGAATRSDALATQVSDAVGLTSDSRNIYYTRGMDRSVWMRPLAFSCDGSGDPERMIGAGYEGIGNLIAYQNKVAWFATGDRGDNFSGGGIFEYEAASNTIEQIAPEDDGVEAIAQAPSFVIFATADGFIRRVDK